MSDTREMSEEETAMIVALLTAPPAYSHLA
jgi:hypothetical protein